MEGDSQKRTGENTARQNSQRQQPKKGQILTQHTGLPPRETGDRKRPFNKSKSKNRA